MDKGEVCGLEVSARELVVAMAGKKGDLVTRRFANTAVGHRALLHALTRGGEGARVCMEATGVYGLDVALFLSARPNVQLMVANPRAVRHFAQALMQRSKSDLRDAVVLREFAARMPFTRWARPDQASLALWAIARRLQTLTQQRAAEKNRRHAAGVSTAIAACVRRSIDRTLCFLDAEIRRLRKEALACIAAEPCLQKRYRLLRTMPGVGESSAVQILAELALLPPDRDVRQWVAFAGLDPREYSSGTSVRKKTRISKIGNRHLRHALFMPALVASRREPHLRAFYEHLLAEAKRKKVALIAVARKMLHAIYGMFRWDRPYDGSRVFPLRAPAAHSIATIPARNLS
ncbi:MAG: IS110 family transposase [Candidatus Acidiferrales bacterium]